MLDKKGGTCWLRLGCPIRICPRRWVGLKAWSVSMWLGWGILWSRLGCPLRRSSRGWVRIVWAKSYRGSGCESASWFLSPPLHYSTSLPWKASFSSTIPFSARISFKKWLAKLLMRIFDIFSESQRKLSVIYFSSMFKLIYLVAWVHRSWLGYHCAVSVLPLFLWSYHPEWPRRARSRAKNRGLAFCRLLCRIAGICWSCGKIVRAIVRAKWQWWRNGKRSFCDYNNSRGIQEKERTQVSMIHFLHFCMILKAASS